MAALGLTISAQAKIMDIYDQAAKSGGIYAQDEHGDPVYDVFTNGFSITEHFSKVNGELRCDAIFYTKQDGVSPIIPKEVAELLLANSGAKSKWIGIAPWNWFDGDMLYAAYYTENGHGHHPTLRIAFDFYLKEHAPLRKEPSPQVTQSI